MIFMQDVLELRLAVDRVAFSQTARKSPKKTLLCPGPDWIEINFKPLNLTSREHRQHFVEFYQEERYIFRCTKIVQEHASQLSF